MMSMLINLTSGTQTRARAIPWSTASTVRDSPHPHPPPQDACRMSVMKSLIIQPLATYLQNQGSIIGHFTMPSWSPPPRSTGLPQQSRELRGLQNNTGLLEGNSVTGTQAPQGRGGKKRKVFIFFSCPWSDMCEPCSCPWKEQEACGNR